MLPTRWDNGHLPTNTNKKASTNIKYQILPKKKNLRKGKNSTALRTIRNLIRNR